MIENLRKIAKKARDEFISSRKMIEESVTKHRENLSKLPIELQNKLPFNTEELYTEKFFPSLYIEPFNEQQYKREREDFEVNVLAHVNKLKSEIIAEAEEVLKQYGHI